MVRQNGGDDRVVPSFDISGLRNLSPEPQREKSHALFHIGAQSIASTGARGSAQQTPASQPYPTLKFMLALSPHLPSEVSTHKQHSPSLCPPQSGQRKELWRQSLPVVSAFPTCSFHCDTQPRASRKSPRWSSGRHYK